jgi:DNA-binding MarR family transcriptional regulator
MSSLAATATVALTQNAPLSGVKLLKGDGFGMNGDLNEAVFGEGEGQTADDGTASRVKSQPTVEERKLKSFRVYLDILDTAEWLRRQFAEQLDAFDLTIGGFRLMEVLYREGPITTEDFCKKRRYRRQSLDALVKRLKERGWVQFEVIELEPSEIERTRLPKKLRDVPRRGRRVGRVSLTEDGTKFMHIVFPRHAKLVFAFMKALDSREQETVSRACKKLREGDVVKMLNEISMEEV